MMYEVRNQMKVEKDSYKNIQKCAETHIQAQLFRLRTHLNVSVYMFPGCDQLFAETVKFK